MRVTVLLLAAVAAAAAAASPEDGPRAGYLRRPHELDSFSYLLPRLRYRPWADAQDEFAEDGGDLNEQDPELGSEERFKRGGPSLSIVNPLDVLRQRLLLEIARRQMRESSRQVAENRKLMKAIGKRGQTFLRQPDHRANSIGYDTM